MSEGEPLPEALIWLLLTGEIPTAEQTQELTDEFGSKFNVLEYRLVEVVVDRLHRLQHCRVQLRAADRQPASALHAATPCLGGGRRDEQTEADNRYWGGRRRRRRLRR